MRKGRERNYFVLSQGSSTCTRINGAFRWFLVADVTDGSMNSVSAVRRVLWKVVGHGNRSFDNGISQPTNESPSRPHLQP